MVLQQLGSQIASAISKFNSVIIIDEKALTVLINEITHALLQADVDFNLVKTLSSNVRRSMEKLQAGHDKRHIVQKAVRDELITMLDPGNTTFAPSMGRTNVVMLVGLQGSGKTTTCTKYALHYRKKGFKPALVCADTFRAGAFDQLKQNANKVNIPFYGSYTETDPVAIAQEGLKKFTEAKCDLIILDTSGRHKQESALFEEMNQLAAATKPDFIVLVMDSSIGQVAGDQAMAFRNNVKLGGIVITKMDGHGKGGGALSAVATTKCPIVFLGTGEKADDFESFEPKSFVNRLLGKVDIAGLVDKLQETMSPLDESQVLQRFTEGNITFQLFWDQVAAIGSMGSLSQIMSMIPGQNKSMLDIPNPDKYRTVLDSMTNEERNSSTLSESRIQRIARGSGTTVNDVQQMVTKVKILSKKLKDLKLNKKAAMLSQGRSIQELSRMLPQNIVQGLGIRGLANMI